MAEITVTEQNRGGVVTVRVGDLVVVQLAENPTTGFRWAPVPASTSVLEQKGDDFQIGAQSGIGGGGLRVFRFLAKSVGLQNLDFKLARSWESEPPKAVFNVTVNIGGG